MPVSNQLLTGLLASLHVLERNKFGEGADRGLKKWKSFAWVITDGTLTIEKKYVKLNQEMSFE